MIFDPTDLLMSDFVLVVQRRAEQLTREHFHVDEGFTPPLEVMLMVAEDECARRGVVIEGGVSDFFATLPLPVQWGSGVREKLDMN